MTSIWVDADACPKAVKEVIYRAARRAQMNTTLIANQMLMTPPSAFIKALQVPAGLDVADNEIVRRLVAGDLVVTADIPLAAQVVAKGGLALNPRGEWYTQENVQSLLSMRNFMQELRDSGTQTGGPAALSARDVQQFANALDRWLAKIKSRN
ncbi:YaiI/YqxD family protein [Hydromonas duriensis]|uniref:UPF0178 protein DFR44_11046 n=1 Tax=Hydromonas duriensis TaxID=1527608 RepID=A0A4R6Y7R4_9BURK|nr:YaiI/YqxD family protein [Hydromonas duriensis]TDR31398.1 hypothetical protein DFR44_11046 [Hydromonas duriensis]